MRAKKGGMVVKIDLESAYGRMEWAFVEETLRNAALPIGIINVIMGLLSQSNCKLIWNGKITDTIKRTRGLRQGNPLSPYIFVLCLECLSYWIQLKVNEEVWKRLRLHEGVSTFRTSSSLMISCFSPKPMKNRWTAS